MNTNFKVGEFAVVVENTSGHEFPDQTVVKIVEIDSTGYMAEYKDGHDYWFVSDDDLEPLKEAVS